MPWLAPHPRWQWKSCNGLLLTDSSVNTGTRVFKSVVQPDACTLIEQKSCWLGLGSQLVMTSFSETEVLRNFLFYANQPCQPWEQLIFIGILSITIRQIKICNEWMIEWSWCCHTVIMCTYRVSSFHQLETSLRCVYTHM